MVQPILGIFHDPLFQVFINVRKSYDSLDRGRFMEILRGYDLGTNLQRLLKRHWEGQKVVPKSGKCFGRLFCIEIGVKQGFPVSLEIFTILLNALVRVVLLEVCGAQEAQHGIGWSEKYHKICFYVDNGWIAG